MADCNPNDCAVGVRVTALEKEFDRYRTNSSDTGRTRQYSVRPGGETRQALGRAGGQAPLRGGPGLGGGESVGARNIKTALKRARKERMYI